MANAVDDIADDTQKKPDDADVKTAEEAPPPPPPAPARRARPWFLRGWPLYLLLFLALLAAFCKLRSHTFRAEIAHDEAVFIYGGQAWANGELPYRDFWDHKPPHIFLFHSLPLRFFPFSREALLIHELLWLALAATLFAAVCRLYLSRIATLFGLVFFCFFVSSPVTIRTGGLTEESSLVFVALSYLMILRPSRRFWLHAFLAGLFLGMAAEFRQTFAPSLLFLLVAAWWRGRKDGLTAKARLAAWLLCGAGFVVPELVWSAFFALHGAWREYFEASYLFNFFYIGAGGEIQGGFREGLEQTMKVIRDTGPVLLGPVFAAALCLWLPRTLRWLAGLAVVAFVCEFLPVSISGEYYHHYYVQATVSSCFSLALAAEAVRELVAGTLGRSREGRPGILKILGGIVVTLGVLAAVGWLTDLGVRDYVRRLGNLKRAEVRVEEQTAVAGAITRLTAPDERILLLGVQPNACYFTAKRYAGARYYHNSPLFKAKFQDYVTSTIQQRMLDDVMDRRPVLILLGTLEGERDWRGMDMFDQRKAAAFLRAPLEREYVPLETIVDAVPQEWYHYQQKWSCLVRKDMVDTIRKRLEESETEKPAGI